jgi:hypothetical protein
MVNDLGFVLLKSRHRFRGDEGVDDRLLGRFGDSRKEGVNVTTP